MCTKNEYFDEVNGYRKGDSPKTITAFKAVKTGNKKGLRSGFYNHVWKKGWNQATGAITCRRSKNGAAVAGANVECGALHVSRTLTQAQNWIGENGINAVIEVVIRLQDIVAISSNDEIAVSKVFVESTIPVYILPT